MENSKLDYSAPETEVVVVRIERQIMSPAVQLQNMARGGYVDEDEIELM